ncbi:hypothetical protein PanWU01x14_177530 [Parasponia andersonii]|uniref:Uncharacterized protein n=1 Tax=Parasponia andersonii TaxID=3476 RepID=A0A2P5C7L7_PARAD|nr:hypothetical protein PanWU01x14_177530 [Parasponia andersonii]
MEAVAQPRKGAVRPPFEGVVQVDF